MNDEANNDEILHFYPLYSLQIILEAGSCFNDIETSFRARGNIHAVPPYQCYIPLWFWDLTLNLTSPNLEKLDFTQIEKMKKWYQHKPLECTLYVHVRFLTVTAKQQQQLTSSLIPAPKSFFKNVGF